MGKCGHSMSLASIEEQIRLLQIEERQPQDLTQYMVNLEKMRALRVEYMRLVTEFKPTPTGSTSPFETPEPP